VELRVHRLLPYPTERVWRALTDPVALAAWFWPQRFEPTAEVDLRVGGRYRITAELTPRDTGTELVIVHERFTDGAVRDDHAKGWTDCLDRLPGWLAAT
jgi:uncharacterized protein YndB with AHSA1/START domain